MVRGPLDWQVTVTVRRQHNQRLSSGTPFLPGMGLFIPPGTFSEAPRTAPTFSAHIITMDRRLMKAQT